MIQMVMEFMMMMKILIGTVCAIQVNLVMI